MSTDKREIRIIGLVPVSHKTKEELELEQPGLEVMRCPYCEQESWISYKKRIIIKNFTGDVENYDLEVMCWDCVKAYASTLQKPLKKMEI
jgi:hypothetical protein